MNTLEGDPHRSEDAADPSTMHPRLARQKLALAEDTLTLLDAARRARLLLDSEVGGIEREMASLRVLRQRLADRAGDRIERRKRTPATVPSEHSPPRPEYAMFLDECGSSTPSLSGDRFPVFCVCGIIVNAECYQTFNRLWKTWKANWLGSPHVRVHEPDVRRRSDRFNIEDPARRDALYASLSNQIQNLEFTCIAAVIDKQRFSEKYPTGDIDDFLPHSFYLTAIVFIIERFTHFLYHKGHNGWGRVYAESRGLREDVEIQSEYLRLHLNGTQWISESQFRSHLQPSITFEQKHTNNSGLQIADLAARPIAEKVLRPESSPERWDVVVAKFYDGMVGRPRSYGLKVFPDILIDVFERDAP